MSGGIFIQYFETDGDMIDHFYHVIPNVTDVIFQKEKDFIQFAGLRPVTAAFAVDQSQNDGTGII